MRNILLILVMLYKTQKEKTHREKRLKFRIHLKAATKSSKFRWEKCPTCIQSNELLEAATIKTTRFWLTLGAALENQFIQE